MVAKKQWRKAEKTWRTSRSHTNLLGFCSVRNYVTFLMNKAHCDYYTNFVNVNSVNQRRLFNASKSLLNISRSASLPLSSDDHQLPNNFGASFTKKINAIISAIPMVPLTIPLFQNSTFSPNLKYMASLHYRQRHLVLLIPYPNQTCC